jgi:hypothetical protein
MRDILVLIRIRGSVPLTDGSVRYPTPEPTPFFSDFKDATKNFLILKNLIFAKILC